MLLTMGAHVTSLDSTDGAPIITFRPPPLLEPLDIDVPGDFSAAAFFIALATLLPAGRIRIPGVGVNPTRTGMLHVLRRMGAAVDIVSHRTVCGEPVADILVKYSPLRATTIAAPEIPLLIDEVPALAVMAARADGETRFCGAAELRVKESDRLHAVVANLQACGVRARELDDGLIVHGSSAPLRGTVEPYHDHRIAMAFGILASLPGNRIVIRDPDCASVSFPGFWSELQRCARGLLQT
jgi:3-phosphoshikimate 1-carboxyvinyltransferase